MTKKIIDYITNKQFSKIWAKQLLANKKVTVNNRIITDENFMINDSDIITIDQKKVWVSRGALKLLAAIEKFDILFFDKTVLDIGASTGGFTEVSLRCGAKKVYALDVGTNQLDYKLRIDKRVVVYEKTHLKKIDKGMFAEKIDIVVVDVAFISLKHVFKALAEIIHPKINLVVLIKPQFEAFKYQVTSGGIVEKKYHQEIINRINDCAFSSHFILKDMIESPIKGLKAKNIEYIAHYACE